MKTSFFYGIIITFACFFGTGCATLPTGPKMPNDFEKPDFEINAEQVIFSDLPEVESISTIAISFSDKTGKRGDGLSDLSTVLSQGLNSTVIKAAQESGYFKAVERENLRELLIERDILKNFKSDFSPPPILPAKYMLHGAAISYQRNVRSGGIGAAYFGLGADASVREDTLTVSLRIISPKNSLILHSESSSKTVFSVETHANFFRYLSHKKIGEGEGGIVNTELVQRCVYEAIKKALKNIILEMILAGDLKLKNPEEINTNKTILDYRERREKIKY